MALENDAKIQHATEFLAKLNSASPLELAQMMQEDIGTALTDALAGYAEKAGSRANTQGESADVARAMIMIGYCLRAAEERAALLVAQPISIPGTYRH